MRFGKRQISFILALVMMLSVFAVIPLGTSAADTAKAKTDKSVSTLAQPTVKKLENIAAGTKLTWGKVSGAGSYKVYLKNGSSWKGIGTVKTNTYTYKKVKSGTTYTYTVRAVGKNGKTLSAYNKKGWSKKFVAVPQITSLTSNKDGISIKWKAVSGASAYRVYYKASNGKWKNFKKDVKGFSKTDVSVVNGRKETYTVRALDGKGNPISDYNHNGWSTTYRYGSSGKSNNSGGSNNSGISNNAGSTGNTGSGNSGGTVYITPTGKKYHISGCRYCRGGCTAISLSDALARGYTACLVCKP